MRSFIREWFYLIKRSWADMWRDDDDEFDIRKALGLGTWKDLWHSLTYPCWFTWRWFKKCLGYSKILWNDYDFDWNSILRLLQYKIKRLREHIEYHHRHVDMPIHAAQMKHAEDLIQAYFDDNFCEDLEKAHEEKWGKGEMIFTPCEDKPKFSTMEIKYPKATTPEENEQANNEKHEIYQKSEEARRECLTEIFNHISKYIEYWWD